MWGATFAKSEARDTAVAAADVSGRRRGRGSRARDGGNARRASDEEMPENEDEFDLGRIRERLGGKRRPRRRQVANAEEVDEKAEEVEEEEEEEDVEAEDEEDEEDDEEEADGVAGNDEVDPEYAGLVVSDDDGGVEEVAAVPRSALDIDEQAQDGEDDDDDESPSVLLPLGSSEPPSQKKRCL